MKNYLPFIIALLPFFTNAQGVAVNTSGDAPHSSAMLDIGSNTRGLLVPRMTTAERNAITGPAVGLTVFDLNTYSYWMYRGDVNGGWAEMLHQFQNVNNWNLNGAHIYNNNTGNVGIGTSNPTEKLAINGANAAIQFMNSNVSRGFLQVSGTNMKLGTYANNTTGNIVFSTQAVDRVWIDEAGLVGIGTSSPSAPLTINGTDPFLQMRNANVNKGFARVQANDLKIGTNATNTTGKLVFQTKETDRVWIDENGLVGIGTADPTTSLTINGTNPMIQMNNQASEKGFIQVSGSDFKIGTNQANTTGNFIIRTQGVDRFRMNQFGEAVFSDNIADHELTLETGSPAIGFSNNTLANAQINLLANNDFKFSKNATNGGRIILHNSSNIANSYALYLTTGGHLNFGTGLSPTGYRASVEGKVIATDFVTLSIANWPDYVFAEQYHLRSISELKNYIQQHKHLPNIPPAAEMEKNGIQLGEMTRKLVEKLEEQALYIIQLEERLEKLEKTAGK